MTACPMSEGRADELLDAFEQAISDRAEDGMSYRHHVDGPRDEAREALRAALLSTSAAVRGMREALELVRISNGWRYMADETKAIVIAALSGIEPGGG
jgi:hypothetical protein